MKSPACEVAKRARPPHLKPGTLLRCAQADSSLRLHVQANQHASWYHSGMAHSTLSLIEAMQRLAEVQGRLGEHLDAWATLTEALPLLQSSVLAQAMELMEARNPTSAS